MNQLPHPSHSQGPQSPGSRWRQATVWAVLATVLVTAGCTTRRVAQPAPVEDRSTARVAPRILPGAENAGKPGYYTVRPGDTLFRIALDNGRSRRDLQEWNAIANPNLLEVGQVLRVVPPESASVVAASTSTGTSAASTSPVTSTGVAARPLGPAGTTTAPVVPPVPTPPAPSPAPTSQPAGADDIQFAWPAQGTVVAPFDETKNKGVSIAGRVGDPVVAAADGRVVYAGAGLRGYGNLIILKHNNTYLTAYAHNQALLVREDQSVRQGQKIAEMGSSDTDRVKLHFEVRRLGKPVDPLNHLPKR